MKTLIYSTSVLLVAFANIATAQVRHHKVYKKLYKVSDRCEVAIKNKYGKVDVEETDADSVSIEVEVNMGMKNSSRLAKAVASLHIEFDKTGPYVTAATTIKKGTPIIQDISDLVSSDDRLQIDYTVRIPKSAVVNIDNKFGNVYIKNIGSNSRVRVSHGDLKSSNINKANVEVRFGDLRAKNIESSQLLLHYAKLRTESIKNSRLESKNTRFNIESGKNLKWRTSKRDDINIESIDKLKGEFFFSKIDVTSITGLIDVSMKFGYLNLESVKSGFKELTVDSKYTDIDIKLNPTVALKGAIVHRKVDLDVEGSLERRPMVSDKKDTFRSSGTLGKGSSSATLDISAENCDLNISTE